VDGGWREMWASVRVVVWLASWTYEWISEIYCTEFVVDMGWVHVLACDGTTTGSRSRNSRINISLGCGNFYDY